ncbi:MAG: hypothetical protein ACK4UO_15645 [Pseudolabrys sp.]
MPSHPRSGKPKSGGKESKADKERLERDLEEGLEETFPASDAVAVIEPVPEHPVGRKKSKKK